MCTVYSDGHRADCKLVVVASKIAGDLAWPVHQNCHRISMWHMHAQNKTDNNGYSLYQSLHAGPWQLFHTFRASGRIHAHTAAENVCSPEKCCCNISI